MNCGWFARAKAKGRNEQWGGLLLVRTFTVEYGMWCLQKNFDVKP
jgi:hypothetical protein